MDLTSNVKRQNETAVSRQPVESMILLPRAR